MKIEKHLIPFLAILFLAGTVSGTVSHLTVGKNNVNNVDTNLINANTKLTTWAKGYTLTTNASIARNAIQSPDGSYLVGLDCNSGSCTTIMRLGSNGLIKWQKSYSLIGSTVMVPTSDNGSIIAGQKTTCNKLGSCGSILKVDSNGNIQWENDLLYSSPSPSTFPESIQQTSPDEGYIVAGSAHGSTINYSTWVVKLNSSGHIQWQKFFSNPGSNGAIAIKQTSDGYVIAGYSLTNSANHILVIKLDSLGNLVWQRIYTTNYGSLATSLQLTSDGGYIISGDVYTLNYFPAILLKLDSKGNIQWSKTYSDAGAGIQLNSVIQTADGGYALSGYIYDGNDRAWLAKTDGNGSIKWQKTYGSPTSDRIFSSVNQTSDGGFVASGATKQFSGDFDSWIVRVDSNGNIVTCPDVQGASVIASPVSVTSGLGGLSIITNGNVYVSDISTLSSVSYTPIKEC